MGTQHGEKQATFQRLKEKEKVGCEKKSKPDVKTNKRGRTSDAQAFYRLREVEFVYHTPP